FLDELRRDSLHPSYPLGLRIGSEVRPTVCNRIDRRKRQLPPTAGSGKRLSARLGHVSRAETVVPTHDSPPPTSSPWKGNRRRTAAPEPPAEHAVPALARVCRRKTFR